MVLPPRTNTKSGYVPQHLYTIDESCPVVFKTNGKIGYVEENEQIKEEDNEDNKEEEKVVNPKPGYTLYQQLTIEQEDYIKTVLVMNHLVDDFETDTINEFAIGFFKIEFDEGQTIYTEGEEAKMFYIIESGIIELSYTKDNNEKRELAEGNFFGIESFEECSYRIENAKVIKKNKSFMLQWSIL